MGQDLQGRTQSKVINDNTKVINTNTKMLNDNTKMISNNTWTNAFMQILFKAFICMLKLKIDYRR